ncbi:MAG: GPW/gp25 family protein [Synergistaceae bacterium]|nr:GPW/gp25 family protein [Synergistaceae bacterium]
MNDYVLIINPGRINFAPDNLLEEIVQNVNTICSTPKFSVPMDRAFGIDTSLLDEPMSKVAAKYRAEIIQAVRKFEPRARISRVEFYRDEEAKQFRPKVWLRLA